MGKFLLLAILSMVSFSVSAQVSREVDDFDGEVTIASPYGKTLHLTKVISQQGGSIRYYLFLRTTGLTLNVREKGVIVLFSDGTKWSRDTKIDVDSSDSGWEYSAFIPIRQTELNMLCDKTISKFRLYIYDKTVGPTEASRFNKYCRQIRDMK